MNASPIAVSVTSPVVSTEEASHAFFKSTAFLEFAADPDSPEKKRYVEQTLSSHGPINCSIIEDQLYCTSCSMYAKQILSEMILEICRNR